MLYMIREWNKVRAGLYESDQKTFDYNTGEYIALYRIAREGSRWEVYGTTKIDPEDEMKGLTYTQIAPSQKTLKDAEKIAEDIFGEVFRAGDYEEAMRDTRGEEIRDEAKRACEAGIEEMEGKDKMKKITAKEAYKIMDRLGLAYGDDGVTFYATNEDESEVYEFDSLKEREDWMKIVNKDEETEEADNEEMQEYLIGTGRDNEWKSEQSDKIADSCYVVAEQYDRELREINERIQEKRAENHLTAKEWAEKGLTTERMARHILERHSEIVDMKKKRASIYKQRTYWRDSEAYWRKEAERARKDAQMAKEQSMDVLWNMAVEITTTGDESRWQEMQEIAEENNVFLWRDERGIMVGEDRTDFSHNMTQGVLTASTDDVLEHHHEDLLYRGYKREENCDTYEMWRDDSGNIIYIERTDGQQIEQEMAEPVQIEEPKKTVITLEHPPVSEIVEKIGTMFGIEIIMDGKKMEHPRAYINAPVVMYEIYRDDPERHRADHAIIYIEEGSEPEMVKDAEIIDRGMGNYHVLLSCMRDGYLVYEENTAWAKDGQRAVEIIIGYYLGAIDDYTIERVWKDGTYSARDYTKGHQWEHSLRTNSKEARQNIISYIRQDEDYMIERAEYDGWDEGSIERLRTDDDYLLAYMYQTYIDEYYRPHAPISRLSRANLFREWARGLALGGLFCYYYNRSAIDDLGDILHQSEQERRKYTEEEAEECLTRLIFREMSRAYDNTEHPRV